MYILRLSDADTFVLALCILALSAVFGLLADRVLRDSGLGTIWNSLLFVVGGTFGLFVLDYIATYQYFPYYEPKSQAWILSGVVGGAVLLVIASYINMLFCRKSMGV